MYVLQGCCSTYLSAIAPATQTAGSHRYFRRETQSACLIPHFAQPEPPTDKSFLRDVIHLISLSHSQPIPVSANNPKAGIQTQNISTMSRSIRPLHLLMLFLFPCLAATASNPTVTPMPPATICNGSCDTLKAQASGGTPGYTYSWSDNGTPISSLIVCPVATATYTVTATDASGHSSSPATVTIYVDNGPPLTASVDDTLSCPPVCAHFWITSPGPFAVWDFGDGATGTSFDTATHCYHASGMYTTTLIVSDFHGCQTSWTSPPIHVLTCAGINDPQQPDENLRFFPNPFRNQLSLQFDMPDQGRNIRIADVMGQNVFNQQSPETDKVLNLDFLPPGIYFLQIQSGNESTSRKICKW